MIVVGFLFHRIPVPISVHVAESYTVEYVDSYIVAGSILISALMKQPVVPGSSLGLCHLLSRNIEEWPPPVPPSTSFNM